VRSSGLGIADQAPSGVHLISGPGRSHYELGNLLFRCSEAGGEVLLKVYRQRKSGWSDFWGSVSERWIERKRGVRASHRRDTEAAGLAAWLAAGFDVPRRIERQRPAWIGDHPFVAMEFVEGRTLHEALEDPTLAAAQKQALVERLAIDQARRHRLALERGDTLLVHEHAMARHVLVAGGRLVTFDLEHAYQPDFPVPVAITHELSSTLRSLERLGESHAAAFVASYAERGILLESCRLFRSATIGWKLYRRYETRRRGALSKTATMERLAARLNA
jgi:hypothetical protein